jgi:hypothetical protein
MFSAKPAIKFFQAVAQAINCDYSLENSAFRSFIIAHSITSITHSPFIPIASKQDEPNINMQLLFIGLLTLSLSTLATSSDCQTFDKIYTNGEVRCCGSIPQSPSLTAAANRTFATICLDKPLSTPLTWRMLTLW